ncbi:hypothetical protein ABZ867_29320 [Streptomyces cinnamoneus]
MSHPEPSRTNQVLKPQPLSVAVLIIVLCFQAGYDAQELKQILTTIMVVLVATAAVRASVSRIA